MSHIKKAIGVLLTMALLILPLGAAFPAQAASDAPILRIRGENTLFWASPEGVATPLYDDGEYVSAVAKAALPLAIPALITGNWDKWSDAAWEQLKPAYDHYKPDAEGNVPADTWINFSELNSVPYRMSCDTVEFSYEFFPDMRVSPMDAADEIHETVERIKALHGADKITLIGQCMGNAYMLAYLNKYEAPRGYAGIEAVVYSTTTANGLPDEDRLFSGTIRLELASAYRALGNYELPAELAGMAGGMLLDLIYDTLDLAYQAKGLGKLTVGVVQNVYDKVKVPFIARVLREYYGRCGGYVSSVTEHYEEYKDYVFPTEQDRQTYETQIAKFDDYYYNVQQRQPEMIRDMQAAGVTVASIAEYGVQNGYPTGGEAALETSDGRVPVSRSSFGATGCRIGQTLPEDYVASRVSYGFADYISPDGQVDASTGLLPETTWYIKNAPHAFDRPVMALATAIVKTPGATVERLREQGWARFLWYTDGDTPLRPLTAEDTDAAQVVTPKTPNAFRAFFRWIKTLFRLIGQLLKR